MVLFWNHFEPLFSVALWNFLDSLVIVLNCILESVILFLWIFLFKYVESSIVISHSKFLLLTCISSCIFYACADIIQLYCCARELQWLLHYMWSEARDCTFEGHLHIKIRTSALLLAWKMRNGPTVYWSLHKWDEKRNQKFVLHKLTRFGS